MVLVWIDLRRPLCARLANRDSGRVPGGDADADCGQDGLRGLLAVPGGEEESRVPDSAVERLLNHSTRLWEGLQNSRQSETPSADSATAKSPQRQGLGKQGNQRHPQSCRNSPRKRRMDLEMGLTRRVDVAMVPPLFHPYLQ